MGVNLRAPGCEKEAGHRGTWCETPFLGNVQKRHHRDKASLLDGEGEWLLLGMGTPQGDVDVQGLHRFDSHTPWMCQVPLSRLPSGQLSVGECPWEWGLWGQL